MREDLTPPAAASRLAEDAAHRLLARAIELDHALAAGSSLEELRHAAQEAGISREAFDLAADEIDPPPALAFGRSPEYKGSFVKQVATNVAAAVLGWVVAVAVIQIPYRLHWYGRIELVFGAFAWLAALGVARKLHARVVELALLGIAVWFTVLLGAQLWFGDIGQRTRPFTIMVAGVTAAMVGVVLGVWVTNLRAARPNSRPPETLLVRRAQNSASGPTSAVEGTSSHELEFGIAQFALHPMDI